MHISYNWLKDFIELDMEASKLGEILTDIGLEVEGIETVESIKGGLEGVVIGEVKSVTQHPNADRLRLTKIDVGHSELLSIVCGAPNVAEGQKVVVALVGSTLYADDKSFKIKKSKIRGEVSEGMLCAEDELGLGDSHDGIMVLPEDTKVGMLAKDHFNLESDTVFEIGLTPNRADAMSHYGVARDLACYFNLNGEVEFKKLNEGSTIDKDSEGVGVKVNAVDHQRCPRYAGITLDNIKVEASPKWLANRLKAIGVKPINNVVDITNYVLHEYGQPLHAFDRSKIEGDEINVRCLTTGSEFVTLDGEKRSLNDQDLMICDAKNPMCIAGVFGGEYSGVSEQTTSIFLESAYFSPVSVRKTAKRHALNTDASYRFERGIDPEITVDALKRAIELMVEICGAKTVGKLIDIYPEPIESHLIEFNYKDSNRLIGQEVPKSTVKKIFEGLEIEILNESKEGLRLEVPAYRVDVTRAVDLTEEVLRMVGFNSIKLPSQMKLSLIQNDQVDTVKLQNIAGDYLANNGFNEIFNNSLTTPNYYAEDNTIVEMVNPLSSELKIMRGTLLFGGLETIHYNINHKRKNLSCFEFGHTYSKQDSEYSQNEILALWMTGAKSDGSWKRKDEDYDFFDLKEHVTNILSRLGHQKWAMNSEDIEHFAKASTIVKGKHRLATLGKLSNKVLERFDIEQDVYYAELNWEVIVQLLSNKKISYKPINKYPLVKRDLALLVTKEVDFASLSKTAKEVLKGALKDVALFDVYEGKNLGDDKKSYGMSFYLQDENKTLTDKQIEGMMNRLIDAYKRDYSAELR